MVLSEEDFAPTSPTPGMLLVIFDSPPPGENKGITVTSKAHYPPTPQLQTTKMSLRKGEYLFKFFQERTHHLEKRKSYFVLERSLRLYWNHQRTGDL